MRLLILVCNIIIPLIMVSIGILYKKNLIRKINKILELFIPIAMVSSGVGDNKKAYSLQEKNSILSGNKKISLIWILSGLGTLLSTILVLMMNSFNVINDTTFLDTSNISIIMLELELAMLVIVFMGTEYILKKNAYKRIN